jgi:hypothetical protein
MRTTHRLRRPPVLALAAVAAAFLGLAGLASPADAVSVDDPMITLTATATDDDDVHGPLDIALVRDRVTQVDPARAVVTYRVSTYTSFRSRRIDGRDRYFTAQLDRDGVPGPERTVVIARGSEELEAQVVSARTGRVRATLPVSRPNHHAIEITGPRRILGARRYSWTSDFHADGSRRCGWVGGIPLTCEDSAPDEGWLLMQIVAWPPVD